MNCISISALFALKGLPSSMGSSSLPAIIQLEYCTHVSRITITLILVRPCYRHVFKQFVGMSNYCRSQTKLREGNVFTHVCLSTGGGNLPSHNAMGQQTPHLQRQIPPPGQKADPPPICRWSTSERYTSYWNASLVL